MNSCDYKVNWSLLREDREKTELMSSQHKKTAETKTSKKTEGKTKVDSDSLKKLESSIFELKDKIIELDELE